MPFLPSLVSDAEAQAHSYERVLFVVWSHGVWAPAWQPSVGGYRDVGERIRTADLADAELGMYMRDSLGDFRNKMSILRGVGMVGAWGHPSSVLTASERGPDNRHRRTTTYPISIDNMLAQHLYPSPPALDVLRLSMGSNNDTHSFVDHNWIAALDADAAFARMFGDGFPEPDAPAPAGPSEAELAARRRLGVVRRSLRQYESLAGRVSGEDLRRVQQSVEHYAQLHATLEARVAAFQDAPPPPSTVCEPFSISGADSGDAKMREQVRLFTQGFACGATRVGYWRLGSSHADTDGAHQAGSANNRRPDGLYTRIMRENCRYIGELMRAFDAVEEGNGRTMLDNTLIVVCSDMATSVIGEHPGMDAPFLLAGGLDGKFRMGEFVDYADYDHLLSNAHGHDWYAGPPHNELFISLMRGAGLQPSDWNGPGFGDYQCVRNNTCEVSRWQPQGKYVRYYHEVHAGRRSPGAELPYIRLEA